MSDTTNGIWYQRPTHHEIFGKECGVTLEPRMEYCDRGNWLAKVWPFGELAREMDSQDGWPRYFMDETRAKLEIEAWLKKRGQL